MAVDGICLPPSFRMADFDATRGKCGLTGVNRANRISPPPPLSPVKYGEFEDENEEEGNKKDCQPGDFSVILMGRM
jgi:hypothetical protein